MSTSRTLNVLTLSLGKVLSGLAGFVSMAVLARVLAQRDYATYRQALMSYTFAVPLLSLALPNALYYFLPGESGKKRSFLLDNLLMLTALGGVFAVFLLCGGSRLLALRFNNPQLSSALKIIAAYPIFMLPLSAMGACLLVQNRVRVLATYNVLSRLATSVAVVAVCLVFRTPHAALVALVATEAVIFLPAIAIMLRACPGSGYQPSWTRMLDMVKYSVPLGLAGMLGAIFASMDKVIVSSMSSPEDFAVYVNGATELPLIGVVTGSIASVILADMASMCRNGKPEKALDLFRQASLRSAVLLLPTMCYLMACAPAFIETIFSTRYAASATPFRMYLLLLPARIVFYGPALMALKKTRVVLASTALCLVLNVFLSVLLVQVFGYIGAISSTIATVYLCNITISIRALAAGFKTRWDQILPLRKLGGILLIGVACAPLAFVVCFLAAPRPWLALGLSAVVYWPSTLWFLHRMGHLKLPPWLSFRPVEASGP